LSLPKLLSSALVLGEGDDRTEVRLRQALEVRLQTRPPALQLLAPRVQRLRHPVTSVGRCQRPSDVLGMLEELTEVVPDQVVELLGRSEACRTALGLARLDGMLLAATAVVGRAALPAPAGAGERATPATHQGAQQILVAGVVPPGELAVLGELGL